jgi:voltage-gated potassium channel
MKRRSRRNIIIWDDVVMMLLAVASAVLLILELTTNPTVEESLWYANADLAISIMFLTEFTIKFFAAPSKKTYFKYNWWYILASIPIPVLHGFELLQLLRFVRLFKLARITTGIPELHDYFSRYTKATHFVGVAAICLSVIFYGSILFYNFEYGVNPHVGSVPESIAWVASTVVTVGYSEVQPATTGGRIVGTVAILTGVLVICILSGLAAAAIKDKKKPRGY